MSIFIIPLLEHEFKIKSKEFKYHSPMHNHLDLVLTSNNKSYLELHFAYSSTKVIYNLENNNKYLIKFLNNKISISELLDKVVPTKYDCSLVVEFDYNYTYNLPNALFKNCVNEKLLDEETKLVIKDYIKNVVPKMVRENYKESNKTRAMVTLLELSKSKLIDDVIMLNYDDEFFWFVLKTQYDRNYLYSRLELSYSEMLYEILFEHSLITSSNYGYLINQVRELVLPITSLEIPCSIGLGSSSAILINNAFRELSIREVLGAKIMNVTLVD